MRSNIQYEVLCFAQTPNQSYYEQACELAPNDFFFFFEIPYTPSPACPGNKFDTLQHRCLRLRPHIRCPSSFSSIPSPISVALLRRRCTTAANITTPPPPLPSASSVIRYFATMAANRGMIEASMEAAGFCVNSRGGAYKIGKARPLQDKAAIVHKYFELDGGESVSRTTVMLTLLHFPNQTISSLFPDTRRQLPSLGRQLLPPFLTVPDVRIGRVERRHYTRLAKSNILGITCNILGFTR